MHAFDMTGRRTDGQTDNFLIAVRRLHVMQRVKSEYQQDNVKYSDGLPEKQIAHQSWSPK